MNDLYTMEFEGLLKGLLVNSVKIPEFASTKYTKVEEDQDKIAEGILNMLDTQYDNANALIAHTSFEEKLKDNMLLDHRGKQRLKESKKLIFFTPHIPKTEAVYMPIIKPMFKREEYK